MWQLAALVLIGQGWTWQVEYQEPPQEEATKPVVWFITSKGCIPCQHAKARLKDLRNRHDIDFHIQDVNEWNARVSGNMRVSATPTVFTWKDPEQNFTARLVGGAITERSVKRGLGLTAIQRIVQLPVRQQTHMERMRAKYGTIPSRHCGRRGCSMCNEIFGTRGSYAPSRRRWRWRSAEFKPNYEDFNPTPMMLVKEAVKLADLGPDDTLVDLGCGDGRILHAGLEAGAGRAIGVERNPKTAMMAHDNTDAEIVVGDITSGEIDLEGKKVFVYLYPETLEQIPGLETAEMVVSFCHKPPQLADAREVSLKLDDGEPFTMFVWEKS